MLISAKKKGRSLSFTAKFVDTKDLQPWPSEALPASLPLREAAVGAAVAEWGRSWAGVREPQLAFSLDRLLAAGPWAGP